MIGGAAAWAGRPGLGDVPSVESDASGWAIVTLRGEQDIYTLKRTRAALHEGIAVGAGQVVVDLVEVTFGDSSLLGALVGAVRMAHRRNGTVRVVISDSHLYRKIKITGLGQVLHVFPTLADALKARS